MNTQIEFKVYGKKALFSEVFTRSGGEKSSYPVPTYQALVGITESIYWKPTIKWVIDEVRIMNEIKTHIQSVKTLNCKKGTVDLSYYKYLSDVCYEVKAHFEFNLARPDLAKDRNVNKHLEIAKRMIERGGRKQVFLGTSECFAYVEPVEYGKAPGYYDNINMELGTMFHSFKYQSSCAQPVSSRFWSPTMINGAIKFVHSPHSLHEYAIRPASESKIKSTPINDVDKEYEEVMK